MNRNNLIILLCLTLAAMTVFFFIKPYWQATKPIKLEISQKKEEIIKLKELLAKTESLKSDYELIKEDIERLSLAMPQKEDLPFLIIQFSALSSENGLLLRSIGLENADRGRGKTNEDSGNAKTSKLNLNMTGSYNSLKNFLAAAEANLRFFEVNALSLGGSSGETGIIGNNFNIQMDLSVYFQ